MSENVESLPAGIVPTAGFVHKKSPLSVSETVDHLEATLRKVGATLFATVDHSGEAQRVGLSLRETRLLIFGNPVAGTPVMVASPLAAIDLPLKVLVWADDEGVVWMSYLTPQWLAHRHGLSEDLAAPLAAVEAVTSRF